MLRLLIGFFCIGLFAFSSSAQEVKANGYTRTVRLGVSENALIQAPMSESAPNGVGLLAVYEFNLNSRFLLGIDLEYRIFPGYRSVHQLGYGLLMKHALPSLSENSQIKPYLEYGLLFNVTRQKGRDGAGTAHDTRLAAGADFKAFERNMFADLSYHFSRLSYFEQSGYVLDYFQVTFGSRFAL